jgi:hypothetical protein
MSNKEHNSTVKFIYSHPFESTMLRYAEKPITSEHHAFGRKQAYLLQELWNQHEREVLDLFHEMYKIDITEAEINVFVSLVLPNSFSLPLTISLLKHPNLETDGRSQRVALYQVIHELAHYFLYSRNGQFANNLLEKIQAIKVFESDGANLHYLIQAVEFGIVGEVFGSEYGEFYRDKVIEGRHNNDYEVSAKKLKDDTVPLNRTCLEYIASLFPLK